jgi:ubiquinone/menaquinone biosynthesis C-methylase UbiE
MRWARHILMRMFGRPQGCLGKLGGIVMARTNHKMTARVIEQLHIRPNDKVLEIGFGPGMGIAVLAALAPEGFVAGVDYSRAMVQQAAARNAAAVKNGLVDLRYGSIESLPFEDNTFDKGLAVNSMQVWPSPVAGLRELRRVIKPGGLVALGFTPYSGQANHGVTELLTAADFSDARTVESDHGFCVMARKR